MSVYKVLKAFVEKESGHYLNERDTFTSSDAERVSFLAASGYIQAPIAKNQIERYDNEADSGEENHQGATSGADLTFNELKEEASTLKIKGYTKMTEEELRTAIDAVNAKKASEADAKQD